MGYLIVVHASSGIARIACRTEELIRTVTENHAFAATAEAIRERR